MNDLDKIEARMGNGYPFTFLMLHTLPNLIDKNGAYRLADRTIQKWRRKGLIAFKRQGREFVWSLTSGSEK